MSRMAAKKLIYPAADRNKEPILSVLKRFISSESAEANLLELASGSGQHTAHFAPNFPRVTFQPSDHDTSVLSSIEAHTSDLDNVLKPVQIDVSSDWRNWAGGIFKEKSFDYIYCANMVHISPYNCSSGLFAGAGRFLKNKGLLITYGPYAIDGTITPDSNVRFDESIRAQNPEWGLRDVRDLEKLAGKANIRILEIIDMPANNKTIVWQKSE